MKQGLVFLIQQLVLATVFYIILVSSASFNFGNSVRNDVKIKIGHGNTSAGPDSGKLILYPAESEAHKGDTVSWSIDTTISNVDSFWIEKKKDSTEIFKSGKKPPSKHTKKGSGTIKSIFIKDKAVYYYTIHWKDKQGIVEYKFDPKIAINPTSYFIEQIIYIAYGLFALLLSLRFFLKRNKK